MGTAAGDGSAPRAALLRDVADAPKTCESALQQGNTTNQSEGRDITMASTHAAIDNVRAVCSHQVVLVTSW